MLEPSLKHFVSPSVPRTDTKISLVLWAVFGFALGFAPIIIFLIFISNTKNDRPIRLPEQQAAVASNQKPPSTTKTAAAIDQPLAANHDQPANDNASGHRSEAVPAATQAQEAKPSAVTRAAITPIPLEETAKPSQATHTAADANKAAALTPPVNKKQLDEKIAGRNKQEKMLKRRAKTKTAAVTPTMRLAASLPRHKAGIEQRPEVKVAAIIDTIVNQRWGQNSPGATFPEAPAIECSMNKSEVVCWTDVLTGRYNTRAYRYKIKLILDKFSADKLFVMTYRNLILRSASKSTDEDAGGLGSLPEAIRPGWAPMIHRLPCRLAGQDVIVCSPIGESQFVLKATEARTRSEN